MFEKQGGGTQQILIEVIWLDIQTRVGTPHKIQRKNSVDGWVGGWLHRLFGPLHRLCGIGCTGYVVCCTGYVGMLHRLCGVKADNNAKPAQLG